MEEDWIDSSIHKKKKQHSRRRSHERKRESGSRSSSRERSHSSDHERSRSSGRRHHKSRSRSADESRSSKPSADRHRRSRSHEDTSHRHSRTSHKSKHSSKRELDKARRRQEEAEKVAAVKCEHVDAGPLTCCLVIYEYLFIFLVGFCVGSGCMLLLTIYLIGLVYAKCPKDACDGYKSWLGDGLCYHLVIYFLCAAGIIAAIYILWMLIYYLYVSKKPDNDKSRIQSALSESEESV